MISSTPIRPPTPVPVLAVDDVPANLLALEAVLSDLGCEFVRAESGDAALRLAAERSFALVLLDVMMPEMDGFETLARLRVIDRARTTPVIFLTAREFEQDGIERAYALGAIDFIAKPIRPAVLKGKVTALIQLFEKEQENRHQAEALRTKDHQLAVLAHDVRTPLSVIAIAASRLEQHSDPLVFTTAKRISRASRRLQELNNDVLEAARMAAGKVLLKREQVDLRAICAELLGDFQSSYPGIDFTAELPTALSGQWDRMRLEQAISNLLSNAVKYGTGWVVLKLGEHEGRTLIVVENACPELSDARIEELFAPFTQGARHYRGVGLGLHIVREIAHAHGGTAVGQWTGGKITFTLNLPATSA
jgi:two-component system sensor histidine kinase/response regulator